MQSKKIHIILVVLSNHCLTYSACSFVENMFKNNSQSVAEFFFAQLIGNFLVCQQISKSESEDSAIAMLNLILNMVEYLFWQPLMFMSAVHDLISGFLFVLAITVILFL